MPMERRALVLVLVLTLFFYAFTLQYVESGDSVTYARLAKSFATGEGYSLNGQPYARHLPILPMLAAPFGMLFGNYMLAIRIVVFLCGLVSILAFYRIGRELFPRKDFKFYPLLFLAPFLLLYAMFRGLAEAPLICFSLLSVMFFLIAGRKGSFLVLKSRKMRPHLYYVSGFFLGLAALSRYAGAALGIAYIAYMLLRRSKANRHMFAGVVLGFAMFSLIFIHNHIVFGDFLYAFKGSYLNAPLSENPLWLLGALQGAAPTILLRLIENIILFVPAMLLLASPLFIPHFARGLRRDLRDKNLLLILIIIFSLLAAAVATPRIRYVAPILPFIMVVAYSGYMKSRGWWKHFLIIGISLNILMMPYFLNGNVKDFADSIYPTPPRWSQAATRDGELTLWLNANAPPGSIVFARHDRLWGDNLRADIAYRGYEELEFVSGNNMYLVSDYRTDYVLSNLGMCWSDITQSYSLTRVYERTPLKATIYRIAER